ncbi:SDR family oxidoreductase [Actinoplanes sp. NPDC051633]|uniref:SDR family oxidoreductase n=1 Tax=Actinoplanes sp. NPDC051633 TaxID=3155670 RepID=UPI00343CC2F1
MKRVPDQVVVITGASSGIGRATALAFAARGAKVVCAARGKQALDTLVAEIQAAGGTATAVPTDVGDPAAVRALAEAAEQRYGRIDTWVNNAAVGVWGRVEDITDAEFDKVMRVNFLGQVHGVHAALPALRRAGGGALIGVASVEGIRAVPMHAPYTASKFAVRAFYDALRMEMAQEGAPVAVTTVSPASIDTPFFEHARSRMGAMPKPPPPVYAPEVVAETIVYAARHPRREILVGGAGVGFMLSQRLAPALTDAMFSIRRLGIGAQRTDRPDNGVDNLDGPVDEPGQVRGSHSGRVLRHSAYTRLIGRRARPGDVATNAVRRLRRRPGRLGAAAVARAGWGSVLLLAPEMVLRIAGRAPATPAAVTVARVLGARQVAQAVVTVAQPSRPVALAGAAVDAIHASTDVGLAVASGRWRRIALIDAAIASVLAASGSLGASGGRGRWRG